MFNIKKVKEIILGTLIADAYSLGSHWVYDEEQLKNLHINWDELNAPCSLWHKGKVAGDFTHYGDQAHWLYEFTKENKVFDEEKYRDFWLNKIKTYDGYIDAASRSSQEELKKGLLEGSTSSDLSIVGEISPLLLLSKSKKEFLDNVEKFTKLTHNSYEVSKAAEFFSKLLLKVLEEDVQISTAILDLKNSSNEDIKNYIKKAFASKDKDTFSTIREFGPACDIKGVFPGVLHLLFKYKNLKELLVQNAKAGGDCSARAMIAAMIFVGKNNLDNIPISWSKINVKV